jgi:hypothetical protein
MTYKSHLINPFQKYDYLLGQMGDKTIDYQQDQKQYLSEQLEMKKTESYYDAFSFWLVGGY